VLSQSQTAERDHDVFFHRRQDGFLSCPGYFRRFVLSERERKRERENASPLLLIVKVAQQNPVELKKVFVIGSVSALLLEFSLRTDCFPLGGV